MKDSTMKAPASSRLRIADVLSMDDEEPSLPGGGCMGPVSRCLSRLRRSKAKRVSVDKERCLGNSLSEGDLITGPVSDQSGECRREASFNLGVGCYLLHLIASSKKELDRMTELRKQMETLVRNGKEESRLNDGVVNASESNDVYAYSTTDVVEGVESDDHNSLLSRIASPESLTMKACDRPTSEEMDRLEAELEAELERLQLHLDRQRLLQHGELEREEETVKDTACASQSLSYGGVIDSVTDPQEACSRVDCGVPPYELERRLHEVLETRLQEQKTELEAALEWARYKLRENEKEISWWKDTARLMSKHVARLNELVTGGLDYKLRQDLHVILVHLLKIPTSHLRVSQDPRRKKLSFHICEVSLRTQRLDMEKPGLVCELTLDSVRESLIRQEDTIVFCLIERAKYPLNSPAYSQSYGSIPGFSGSLFEYIVRQTEILQATIGRYENPEEHAFFPDNLPSSLIPPYNCPPVLHPAANSININKMIWDVYCNQLLPLFVAEGNDGNYASTATSDIDCLQALSRRVHYGKFVAEVKFREAPHDYEPAIRAKDRDALMKLLTFEKVEEMVRTRVEKKAMVFGQEVNLDIDDSKGKYKVDPSVVSRLYVDWVMPLTKHVQVEYLLRRLD